MRRAAAVAALGVWAAAAGCRAPARTTVPGGAGAARETNAPALETAGAARETNAAARETAGAAGRAPELSAASPAELRAWFNGAAGQPRLLALVSPS